MREPPKRQLGVGLEAELRLKLEVACALSGNSIAEEIRVRLRQTFAETESTEKLLKAVRAFASEVRKKIGTDWSESETAHKALVAALDAYLGRSRPTYSGAVEDLFVHANDDPATIGRIIEREFHEGRRR
jgi:hypothetical protein